MVHDRPGFDDPVYPAHKVAALVATLADDGVPASRALAGSGIVVAALRAPATRVSYRQMLAVFRNAHRLAPEPTLALRAGRRMHVTAYGMYGYALLSSPHHAAAIALGVKYHRVMGPVAGVAFAREGGTAVWTYEPILATDPADDFYRFVLEFQFSSHRTLYLDLYGATFEFAGLQLAYAAPAHAHAYRGVFGCPVTFAAPRNALLFDAAWIEAPIVHADPITNAMVSELCERSLAAVRRADEAAAAPASAAAAVRRMLVEQPGRFADIDTLADALSITARTLRRRLEAERTSYREILADVRKRLAIEYLSRTDMTTEEIGTRLGYSEAANFRHAFARWTGRAPSEYRSRQAADAGAAVAPATG